MWECIWVGWAWYEEEGTRVYLFCIITGSLGPSKNSASFTYYSRNTYYIFMLSYLYAKINKSIVDFSF